ncbi:MAG: BatA and WFA domain-containing protein [Candidatus Altiarchaeota archaeon]|nr:BatA and WFA domain-containing protein [Candidatus Altiarchaeota archaeon]
MALLDYLSFLNTVQNLQYPTALAGFLLLLPLILLYLLKPKPKHIMIPTIMFIQRMEKEKRFSSILNRFMKDPLLLMQLIIVSLLVLSVAGPFISSFVERNQVEDIVIVVDSSASMKSTDMQPNRFTKAIESAQEVIYGVHDESRVGVVLAGKTPIHLASNVGKEEAGNAIWDAKCSDSTADIPDALALSINLLSRSERTKRIYVFSDFAGALRKEIELHRKLALNRNITVELIKVSGNGRNIGFIHGGIKRIPARENKAHLVLNVKNFREVVQDVSIELLVDEELRETIGLSLSPHTEKLVGLDIDVSGDAHFINVRLTPDDSLPLDNNILLYLPPVDRYRVLLVTNDSADNFLRYAMEASPALEVRKAVFPVIPDFYSFDTVVIGGFSEEMSLPGTFQELEMYVKGGGNLIVVASDSIVDDDIKKLLPVDLVEQRTGRKQINLLLKHKILKDAILSNLLVERFYEARQRNGSNVIALISGSPVLSYWMVGEGRVFFLGVNPSPAWSNFYLSSSLPIFAYQLLNWINSDESELASHSFKTTDYLISTEDISTILPSGLTTESRNLLLDDAGLYRITSGGGEDVITANLFDEGESDISNATYEGDLEGVGGVVDLIEDKKSIVGYLIALVLLLLFLEVLVYRRRGKI